MLLEVAKRTWKRFQRINAGTHASSIAFFFFMSITPLLILFACLVPVFGFSVQDIVDFVCDFVPDALDDFATMLVEEAYSHTGIAVSLSILTLLWTATQGAKALRRGLNAAYGEEERRNFIALIGISIAFIAVFMAVMAVMIYLVFINGVTHMASGAEAEAVGQDTPTLLHPLILLVVGILVFAACYTFLTAGKRKFAAQLPGAVFAALVWFGFTFAFRIYVDNFNRFDLFYGSIGTVALFLFWMFCIFYILLLGGFINHELADWIEAYLPGNRMKNSESPASHDDGPDDSEQEDEMGHSLRE